MNPIETALKLGNLLQIKYIQGSHLQLSDDIRDFEIFEMKREDDELARQVNFNFQRSLGPAAVQAARPDVSGRAFPKSQQATTSEHTAVYNEIDTTIELEYQLYKRALKSPKNYADPLEIEMDSKMLYHKRYLGSVNLYGDGTGVMATVLSVDQTNIAAGTIVVTAKAGRGFVGWAEWGDLFVASAPDATDPTGDIDPTGGSGFAAYRVLDKSVDDKTLTLELVNAAGAVVTGYSASNLSEDDVFYRLGQSLRADLTGAIADYGSATPVMAGLESLAANDGRVIHGITMNGAAAGTRIDCGGALIDAPWLQKALSRGKDRVGRSRYKFTKMLMNSATHDSLVESVNVDRRFISVEDKTRGISYYAYKHENDTVEVQVSEFCPDDRIWICPEGSNGKKPLSFYGGKQEPVQAQDGTIFHLRPSASGGHEASIMTYFNMVGVMVSHHPAAIISLSNFTNA